MNESQKHYLPQYLDSLAKSLASAEAEIVYMDWLRAQKAEERDAIKKQYDDLGNALVEAGMMEKS